MPEEERFQKAARAAGKKTREETAERIKRTNELLESQFEEKNLEDLSEEEIDEALEDALEEAKEEVGIKQKDTLRSYIYAAHGEGKKEDYSDHEKVKEAGGEIGEFLTHRTFFTREVKEKVFDLFEENKDSPEQIPLPKEIAQEIEVPEPLEKVFDEDTIEEMKRKKIYNVNRKVKEEYPEIYEKYMEKEYDAQVDLTTRLSDEKKRTRAVKKLAEVKGLRNGIKRGNPDISREEIVGILDKALDSDKHTIQRQIKGLEGEEGAKRYDKYSFIFQKKDPDEIQDEIGFEAYNLMGSLEKDRIVDKLKGKLKEKYSIREENLDSLAEDIYEKEKEEWEKNQETEE